MKKTCILICTVLSQVLFAQSSNTMLSFEKSTGKKTATYHEVIGFYNELSTFYPTVSFLEMGATDSGHPLHLAIFDPQGARNSIASYSKNERNLILTLNGIQAGEPDGIDATMLLYRDFAENKIKIPKNTIIATIPVYNIGGFLNRNSTFRTNQNGPEEYGFRGNARNYDLNRDFIKAETKNAQSFIEIFQLLDPDLLIDNHVSNGADYQYILTHLFTQHNKLGGDLGAYLHTQFIPEFEQYLKKKDWDIVPYVNIFNQKPEMGYAQFYDSPRYSSGYAALFNTLGLTVETHMLKPYIDRVEGTYQLMTAFISIADSDYHKIKTLRKNASSLYSVGNYYPINWEIDSTKTTTLQFKGYEAEWIPSKITSGKRLKFYRDQPFIKDIEYWNHFKTSDSIQIPEAYVVPKGYWNIQELLELNNIEFTTIEKDTTFTAEVYHIASYKTVKQPYEGHYLHYNTTLDKTVDLVSVKNGDLWIPTQQRGIRYILETLEPEARDSFFNWNFFDAILQQKEGFSPYVWEDLADEFLKANPEIKKEFDLKRKSDKEFAENTYRQLDWIHKKSPYYETSHLRYPIVRIPKQ